MNRQTLYAGLLMVFPVGAFGAMTTAYALAAFDALEGLEEAQAAERAAQSHRVPPPAEPEPIPAPRLGDSVLGPAGQGDWLYPAIVIAEPHEGMVDLLFEDGDRGTVPIAFVRPIPRAGDLSVMAAVQAEGRWSEPETRSPWAGSASYPDIALSQMRFARADAPIGPAERLELDTWFRYRGTGPAYPATVVSELTTYVAVVYADGDDELVERTAQTDPPEVGATLEVRSPSGGQPWARATLQAIEGRALRVELGGAVVWVPPARVRWPEPT